MALDITKETFDQVVKEKKITVLDFWAEWCGPCRMLGPIIDDLAKEMTDVTIGKVNVDTNAELSIQYGVTSIPTIVILKDGVEVHRSRGVISKAALKAKIAEFEG